MINIRFARIAALILMGLARNRIGMPNQVLIAGIEMVGS
jgi:hypothetical protein